MALMHCPAVIAGLKIEQHSKKLNIYYINRNRQAADDSANIGHQNKIYE
jgi:hypothetical protein